MTLAESCQWFLLEGLGGLKVTAPLDYLEFSKLMAHARLVLSDLREIQEETTILDILCLTSRENIERPLTLSAGTKALAGRDPKKVVGETVRALEDGGKTPGISESWDGRAAERIVSVLLRGPKG